MTMDLQPGSTVTFTVTVHHEDGSYWAEVEELPGCFAAGDTEDELQESLVEAVGLYLSELEGPVRVEVTRQTTLDDVRREALDLAVCSA